MVETPFEFPERVARFVQSGELFRAREILTGWVQRGPFDARTCEQLGQILRRMGDSPEAGKYLYLSGVRTGEYPPAIDAFLRRTNALDAPGFLPQFPRTIRDAKFEDLPAVVIKRIW